MAFSKRFPVDKPGSPYAAWEETELSSQEEQAVEEKQREENKNLMTECLNDAFEIIKARGLKEYQTNVANIAIALFEKRASHIVFWKEEKAKEKLTRTLSDVPQ